MRECLVCRPAFDWYYFALVLWSFLEVTDSLEFDFDLDPGWNSSCVSDESVNNLNISILFSYAQKQDSNFIPLPPAVFDK